MIGTFINVGAIVAGGVVGLSAKRELAPRHQFFLKTLIGVLALYTGFRMVWTSVGGSFGRVLLQLLMALVALVAGNLLGRWAGLQKQSNKLGAYARERFARTRAGGKHDFSEGFITCSILYCVGPLAIVGALHEGLQHESRTLVLKALMDGLAAMAFARVFGPGAILAALPVLSYQGTLTLLARQMRPVLDHPALIDGFCSAGGLLVAATSLVILDVRKVRLADYLPALLLAPLLRWIVG